MRVLLLVLIATTGWLGIRQMHMAQSAEMAQGLQAAQNTDVIVYVTEWCGVCAQARAYLDARGTAYVALDIEIDPAAFEAYRAAGGKGDIPFFVVDGEPLSGFDTETLDARLAQIGA